MTHHYVNDIDVFFIPLLLVCVLCSGIIGLAALATHEARTYTFPIRALLQTWSICLWIDHAMVAVALYVINIPIAPFVIMCAAITMVKAIVGLYGLMKHDNSSSELCMRHRAVTCLKNGLSWTPDETGQNTHAAWLVMLDVFCLFEMCLLSEIMKTRLVSSLMYLHFVLLSVNATGMRSNFVTRNRDVHKHCAQCIPQANIQHTPTKPRVSPYTPSPDVLAFIATPNSDLVLDTMLHSDCATVVDQVFTRTATGGTVSVHMPNPPRAVARVL